MNDIDLSAIKSRKSMKELNISKTNLTTLQGLALQPNLSVLNAENSQLGTFVNFASIPHASIFFLQHTPLRDHPFCFLGIAIMSDAEKPIVDGTLIPPLWRKRAAKYPPFVRELISAGWPLVFPCPSGEELRVSCLEYTVTYIEDTIVDQSPLVPSADASEETQFEDADFLREIDALLGQHEKVIRKAMSGFGLLDDTEDRLREKVMGILERRKQQVFLDNGDIDTQIITAVRALCLHRER
jgi:hypothetical protein